MTPRTAGRPVIHLTGEDALVREFGESCLAAGLDVSTPRPQRGSAPLPDGFRASATVPRGVIAAVELTNADPARKRKNLEALDASLPAGVPLLSSSVTFTAAAQSDWVKRPERLVGIGAFPTLLAGPRLELAASLRTGGSAVAAAGEVLARIRKEPSVVQDRVGLVMPRILCMVMNEAFFALTEQVASPADIDTAMKLGTNYPRGPLEWANLIGVAQVVAVLDALRGATGEERYRVAPLLYQMSLETGPWKK